LNNHPYAVIALAAVDLVFQVRGCFAAITRVLGVNGPSRESRADRQQQRDKQKGIKETMLHLVTPKGGPITTNGTHVAGRRSREIKVEGSLRKTGAFIGGQNFNKDTSILQLNCKVQTKLPF
jgi:hypothetical protein